MAQTWMEISFKELLDSSHASHQGQETRVPLNSTPLWPGPELGAGPDTPESQLFTAWTVSLFPSSQSWPLLNHLSNILRLLSPEPASPRG